MAGFFIFWLIVNYVFSLGFSILWVLSSKDNPNVQMSKFEARSILCWPLWGGFALLIALGYVVWDGFLSHLIERAK